MRDVPGRVEDSQAVGRDDSGRGLRDVSRCLQPYRPAVPRTGAHGLTQCQFCPLVASVMSPVFETPPVTAPTQPSASAATTQADRQRSRDRVEHDDRVGIRNLALANVEKLLAAFSKSILPDDVTTTNALHSRDRPRRSR